ncbi:hypothetical protein CR513_46058, partial [Mucuna pruriens]
MLMRRFSHPSRIHMRQKLNRQVFTMRGHDHIRDPCFPIVNRFDLHLHSKTQRPIFGFIFTHLLHQPILHNILPPFPSTCELQMQFHILPLVQVKRVRRGNRKSIFRVLFIKQTEINASEVDARHVGVRHRKLSIPRGNKSSSSPYGEVGDIH